VFNYGQRDLGFITRQKKQIYNLNLLQKKMSKSVEREIVDSIKEIQHSIGDSFYNSARKNFETTTVSNKIRIHNDA
tara:strand:- start:148 stop:375 length:228 start_codon:yes stop_codon:yes gene_type:complete